MFYNDDVKRLYLNQSRNVQNNSKAFIKSYQFEVDSDTDLGEMSREEVVQIIKSSNYFLPASVKAICSYINLYRNWYAKNIGHFEPDAPIRKDECGIDVAMRRNLYLSWADVQAEFVDYDYENGDATAPIIALNWLGFRNSEIVDLLNEQVDWKNGLIFDSMHNLLWPMKLVGGLNFEIEPEILTILEKYATTETGTRTKNHVEFAQRADTNYFLYRMIARGSKKEQAKRFRADYTNILIKKVSQAYETKTGKQSHLSTNSVMVSGYLNRIHRYMQTHPSEYESSYKLNIIRCVNGHVMSIDDLKDAYKYYVKAFGFEN